MNILITGATGFIGGHLYDALSEEGHKVIILARKASDVSAYSDENIIYVEQTFGELDEKFLKLNLDGIIHLASTYKYNHTPLDIKEMVDTNITLGTMMLELAKRHNLKWFINTGTLFQHYQSIEYNPVNLYAATKQSFEDIAKFYYETSEMNFVTILLGDTYGPGDTRKKIINLWLEYAGRTETLDMSPGDQELNLLHIDDVLLAFKICIKLLHKSSNTFKGNRYALIREDVFSLRELSVKFEAAIGKSLSINWGAFPYRNREMLKVPKSIQTLPGWSPKLIFSEFKIES